VASSNRPKKAASRPSFLQQMRDGRTELSGLLEAIELRPHHLDAQAEEVHEGIVVHVYQLMCTRMPKARASRWDLASQGRFGERYEAVADKWPAYSAALAELERVRGERRPVVAAMRDLEEPRREYISALGRFYDEFSYTFDFLFPPLSTSHTLG
jgi:hypothetical protein